MAIPGIDEKLEAAERHPNLERRRELAREIALWQQRDAVILPVSTNGWMMARRPDIAPGYEVESGYVNWPMNKVQVVGHTRPARRCHPPFTDLPT